jgi:valyl-tRNA synthetase
VEAVLFLHKAIFTDADVAAIGSIAKLRLQQRPGSVKDRQGLIRSTPDFDLQLVFEVTSQNGVITADSRTRIEKEIEKLKLNIENSERQLSDEIFLSRAPEKVVNSIRTKLNDYREQLAKNQKLLDDAA